MLRPRALLTFFLLLIGTCGIASAGDVAYRVHPQDEIIQRLKMAAASNQDRQATLKKLFADENCAGERLTEQAVKHVKLGNVICTLPGETDDVIIVGAHFDKVPEGMGVTDNWSGASLLPSLFYGLSGTPRKHTYIFIGFTDEEEGMIGSQYYAAHLTKQQRAKVKAVINMDTLGLGPTEVWTSHSDPALLKDLVNAAAALHITVRGMNVDQVGSSDSESFERYKIPRMTLHSVTNETWPVLHSNKDQMSAVKPNDYYESYRLITVFLAYLDGKLGTSSAVAASAK